MISIACAVQRFRGQAFLLLALHLLCRESIRLLYRLDAEGISGGLWTCQYKLGVALWLGNRAVPVYLAWCFFVTAYVHQSSWLSKKNALCSTCACPACYLSLLLRRTHIMVLVYDHATPRYPPGARQDPTTIHGPAFYAIILMACSLYLCRRPPTMVSIKGSGRSRRSSVGRC